MQKVIVERPREGGSWESKPARLKKVRLYGDLEDFDSGPRRPPKRRDKYLNENLAPLKRFLGRNVGRPWDKVYSEIRTGIDSRKATGLHVLQHLDDFVARNCYFEGRKVMTIPRYGPPHEVRGLYVHPRTGFLLRVRSRRRNG